MRIRVRDSQLGSRADAALARRARFILGRHEASIERVEIAFLREDNATVASEECHVTVRLRNGAAVFASEDGRNPDRALLRAAWRIEQNLALSRLRGWQPRDGTRRAHEVPVKPPSEVKP